MTNTIEQALAYAHSHPTRDGGTWHNWCESFIWRAGGFAGSFEDAWLAAKASGWLNPDHAAAPRGSIHYWSNSGRSPGHVAFGLGNDQLLMASNGVAVRFGGGDIGTASWAEYRRNKPDMTYAGWTMRHGAQTLAASGATAGGVTTPLPTPVITSGDNMIILKQPNGTIALVGEHDARIYTAASGGQAFSIGANGKAWGVVDGLTGDEITTLVNEALGRRTALVADVVAAVLKGIPASGAQNTIDYAALAKAVNDNAAARMKD